VSFLADAVLALHVVGALVWVAGTFGLGVVALRARRAVGDSRVAAERVARVARRLSGVLWSALAVTILTGIYNLTWFLPNGWSWSNEVGHVLLVKFALIAVVVTAAGLHSFWVGPRLRRDRAAGVPEERLRGARRASAALGALAMLSSLAVLGVALLLGSL
jgi:uncharacterized membrane protein